MALVSAYIFKMTIREIRRFNRKVFETVNKLLPQLGPVREALTEKRFREIILSAGSHLFVAETDRKEIAGMLTIGTYDIPSGKKFWVEDVVVDEAHRGKGIGKELILFAINYSRSAGGKSVELTSRPSRIEANELYRNAGFILRETNVYRYEL